MFFFPHSFFSFLLSSTFRLLVVDWRSNFFHFFFSCLSRSLAFPSSFFLSLFNPLQPSPTLSLLNSRGQSSRNTNVEKKVSRSSKGKRCAGERKQGDACKIGQEVSKQMDLGLTFLSSYTSRKVRACTCKSEQAKAKSEKTSSPS